MADSLAGLPGDRDRLTLARTLGISERRLLGWEPSERHEHFDADGNLTGWTVVTREPEWDDTQRARMLALRVYENGICACGLHESVIGDPELPLTPETTTCPVCAAVAAYNRQLAEQDRQYAEEHQSDPPRALRPADGRRVRLRPLSPAEVEAARAAAMQGGPEARRRRVIEAQRKRVRRT